MINSKYFFQGFKSIKGIDSPALALGASFIAIGALLKNIGFNLEQSIFSTFLTYALPGSLVMAESFIVGASLINIFLSGLVSECTFISNDRIFNAAFIT